jgi:hypothetical protein
MHPVAIGVNGGWRYVHRVIVNSSHITNLYTPPAYPKVQNSVPLLPRDRQLYSVLQIGCKAQHGVQRSCINDT